MSNTTKVVLVVTAVLVVCLIGVGVVLMANFGGSFVNIPNMFSAKGGAAVQIDEAQDLDLGGVESIKVNCVSGEVIIAVGAPRVELTGNITTNLQKEKFLVVNNSGSELSVRFDANTTFPSFINGDVKMKIWLPEDVAANLDVSGASASIDVEGLSLGNLSLGSASGAISIKDCEGGRLNAGSVSGAVKVENARFASADISCTSGSVYVSDVPGDVAVRNTSGAVRAENIVGSVKVDNTSGSVSVTQPHKDIAAISIGTISGSAEVKLHPDAAFDLTVRSTSGGLSTDFDVLVTGTLKKSVVGEDVNGSVNGGGARVNVSTVSGSIRVNKQ